MEETRRIPIALVVLVLITGCTPSPSPQDGAATGGQAEGPGLSASWLADVTHEVGLDFVHEAGASGEFRLPEIMGSGAALLDADGDGDLDAYLVSGSRDLAGKDGTSVNRLYLQDENGTFEDATSDSGLGDDGYGMGVAVADVDNDGDVDVYLTNYGPDRLYRNRGDGIFEDVTSVAGIDVDGWSSSATFLDYDRDGYLDLYVARYVRYSPLKECMDATGRADYCQPQVFQSARDVLLHNDGDGTFTDVSARAAILGAAAPGLGVVADDFDDDGWADVFVANDGAANFLWINNGDGTFREEAVVRGVAYNLAGRAEAGMGVACADFNDDGRPDLFLTHLFGETNTLYLNRGKSGFEDMTGTSGIAAPSLGMTGFGAVALDLELDGDLDLIVVNGRVTRGAGKARGTIEPPWDVYAERNQVFLNNGAGRFGMADTEAAAFISPQEVSRGLAVGDIDDDGDPDLLLSNTGSAARVYRNDAPRSGSWLTVRARDPRFNRDAIGARVTLVTGDLRRTRTISRGFSYLTSSPPLAYFDVPSGLVPDELRVRWPDGSEETFPVEGVDRRLVVEHGSGEGP